MRELLRDLADWWRAFAFGLVAAAAVADVAVFVYDEGRASALREYIAETMLPPTERDDS
jgi:hypothetical protein